jgi:hypothetical protein
MRCGHWHARRQPMRKPMRPAPGTHLSRRHPVPPGATRCRRGTGAADGPVRLSGRTPAGGGSPNRHHVARPETSRLSTRGKSGCHPPTPDTHTHTHTHTHTQHSPSTSRR